MPAITSTNVANAIVKLVAVDALPALMGNLVMGNLVYLLFHSARAKVLANDTAGALRELGFIERQANQHRNHPFLISQMIGIAEDAIRIRTGETGKDAI